MTDMKRMTISIPAELEQAIVDLRKTDRFCRSSYTEIIREVLSAGLGNIKPAAKASPPPISKGRMEVAL